MADRQSIRAFLDTPVDPALVRDILHRAGRAPSNGNLQPWHVHVAVGPALEAIKTRVSGHLDEGLARDNPGVDVYPRGLREPYRRRRHAAGEERYAALGFPDKDPAGLATLSHLNARCFGAPVGLFFYLHEDMGPHQYCDLGMFMQSIMLLAVERGLDTCPQAFWTNWDKVLRTAFDVAPDMVLVAGMALGWRDPAHRLNEYRTERAPCEDWLHVHD